MPRFRAPRGRRAAFALLPLTVIIATATATGTQTTSAQTSAEDGRMKTSEPVVRIGDRATLRGWFADAEDERVQIQRRAPGAERWRDALRTRTGPRGGYRVRIAPRRTWRWRAVLLPPEQADGTPLASASGPQTMRRAGPARVRVRSRTRARTVNRHVRAGARTRVAGRVRPQGRRKIVIRAAGRRVTTRSTRKGRFSARVRISRPGSYRVRVRANGNRRALASRNRAGRVTAYRPVGASWYGPGFYGNRTACGQTLTPSTMGTAHRTLPCGTKLRLRHRGRTVAVRVIDRGPYVGGRELDLTYATKQRLRFGSTGTVLMSR